MSLFFLFFSKNDSFARYFQDLSKFNQFETISLPITS